MATERVTDTVEKAKPAPRISQRHCFHCNLSWYPRTAERPARCPNCKSRRFDDEALWAHRKATGKASSTPNEFRKRKGRRAGKKVEVAA